MNRNQLKIAKISVLLQLNILAISGACYFEKIKRWQNKRWKVRLLNQRRNEKGFLTLIFESIKIMKIAILM